MSPNLLQLSYLFLTLLLSRPFFTLALLIAHSQSHSLTPSFIYSLSLSNSKYPHVFTNNLSGHDFQHWNLQLLTQMSDWLISTFPCWILLFRESGIWNRINFLNQQFLGLRWSMQDFVKVSFASHFLQSDFPEKQYWILCTWSYPPKAKILPSTVSLHSTWCFIYVICLGD